MLGPQCKRDLELQRASEVLQGLGEERLRAGAVQPGAGMVQEDPTHSHRSLQGGVRRWSQALLSGATDR